MTPNTVNIINKNLLKLKNDKQRMINDLHREIRQIKNQNRVYKEYTDGKISKQDLQLIIEKSEREQNEFAQVKLRKVKVERIQNRQNLMQQENDLLENGEPASMAQLLNLFSGKDHGPAYSKRVSVLEDGNVAPGQAFKPK